MNKPDISNINFMVMGAGRGGTSLVMGLLDAHPKIEVAYETHAMDCLMGFDLPQAAAEHRTNMLDYRIEQFLIRCQQTASNSAPLIWGNKITTEQIYGLHDHNVVNGTDVNTADVFLNEYLSEQKIIFILRDGRTCVRSKISRTGQNIAHAVSRWQYSLEVLELLRAQHKQLHIVKYEQLLVSPKQELAKICQFLGVDYVPEMLAGVRNEKMRKEYRSNKIDVNRLSLKGVPLGIMPLIVYDLKKYGYLSSWQFWWQRIKISRYFSYGFVTLFVVLFVLLFG